MAATVERGGQISSFRLLVVSCDDDYPAGGYSVVPASYDVVIPAGQSLGGDYLAVWDASARTLKVIDPQINKEAASGTDLSGVVFRVLTG